MRRQVKTLFSRHSHESAKRAPATSRPRRKRRGYAASLLSRLFLGRLPDPEPIPPPTAANNAPLLVIPSDVEDRAPALPGNGRPLLDTPLKIVDTNSSRDNGLIADHGMEASAHRSTNSAAEEGQSARTRTPIGEQLKPGLSPIASSDESEGRPWQSAGKGNPESDQTAPSEATRISPGEVLRESEPNGIYQPQSQHGRTASSTPHNSNPPSQSSPEVGTGRGNARDISTVTTDRNNASPVTADNENVESTRAQNKRDQDERNNLAGDVENKLNLGHTEDVDVDISYNPAVMHETIRPGVHEIKEEKIYREVHDYDTYHRIQPVYDVEILPPKHFVPGPDGALIEVSEQDLACTSPPQRWHIDKGPSCAGSTLLRRSLEFNSHAKDEDEKKYISAEASDGSDNPDFYTPILKGTATADRPVSPMYFGDQVMEKRINSKSD
ncbi:hypothetical protein DL767_001365 [Monosporascus sp. MG133]|nr:hypothetical protein DL767_001365 [Monosporascus sp. MG133]